MLPHGGDEGSPQPLDVRGLLDAALPHGGDEGSPQPLDVRGLLDAALPVNTFCSWSRSSGTKSTLHRVHVPHPRRGALPCVDRAKSKSVLVQASVTAEVPKGRHRGGSLASRTAATPPQTLSSPTPKTPEALSRWCLQTAPPLQTCHPSRVLANLFERELFVALAQLKLGSGAARTSLEWVEQLGELTTRAVMLRLNGGSSARTLRAAFVQHQGLLTVVHCGMRQTRAAG
ncbi:hypothetical protein CYMTET_27357 [Cymbomonas tetramitiformis]|uniref:Uncharacterized protein n=1 Tax=Cymbomonas tetramitiformis TaxID=36881 RepID=A0AAE0KX35_9CHLO|nr:hypothetical protein CYMTET_27357 [Cymbomonas tetramitiformis]